MTEWLQNNVGISPDVQINILTSLIIAFGIIFFRWVLVKLVILKIEDLNLRYQWRKISLYISVFIILLFLAFNWLGLIGSVGTFLGLLTAGIAIALKDPIVNVVAWLFILIRQPFKVGDRIQIGNQAGDVIDIQIRVQVELFIYLTVLYLQHHNQIILQVSFIFGMKFPFLSPLKATGKRQKKF
jgi:small-conductance mechanosensitive channel